MTRNDVKNEIIKVLEAKRLSKGLTKEEEERYCIINSEITGIPAKWFSKETGDKLMEVITKTDKLIKLLKKHKG